MVELGVESGRLLEREHETAELHGLVANMADGVGGMQIIEGPAGIGKTRLVETARDAAGELGAGAAYATGSVLEQNFAFGVLLQLFDATVRSRSGELRSNLFRGAAALARPVFEGRQSTDG